VGQNQYSRAVDKDWVPVWMMWALKVSRSTTAAASRGSVKV